MEEYQHVCKLCSKRFPCGRSLGGHMRSHVIMSYSNTEEAGNDEKQKKLSSLSSFDGNAPQTGYGLRENPKKTCRFANSSEEGTLANDKICKECGKGFSSWKALFGHMKCHSEKVGHHHSFQQEDNSWGSDNQRMVVGDQSDNDEDTPNMRRRRRSRRMSSKFRAGSTNGTTASSTLSFANTTNSSSVAEIQQEQEEMALCLMMLSRDVNHNWGGFDSFAESSDIESAFLEPPSSIWADGDKEKTAIKNCQVVKNPGKLNYDKSGYRNLDSGSMEYREKRLELQAYGISNDGLKLKGLKVASETKKLIDDGRRMEANLESYPAHLSIDRQKRNFSASYEPELSWDYSKKSSKRSKFECTTCNKIFHSYQALGGHRASHKKIKGCFASRTDQSSENSIETDSLIDHRLSELSNNESLVDHEEAEKYIDGEAKKLKYKSHECPICFKVFSSGQALGGHKRSHLIGGSDGRISTSHSIVTEKPISEIRDFLDLNLPAPAEEESSSHHVEYSQPWWVVESSHKHEPLVGMIPNCEDLCCYFGVQKTE